MRRISQILRVAQDDEDLILEEEQMSADFNIEEILSIAVQIERNGQRFYSRAADLVSAPALKKLLSGLVVLERAHEQYFIKMQEELSEEERKPATFDPEHETGAYLKALADMRIFDLHNDKLSGKNTPKEIITSAIGMEKDSIVFYLGMKELVPKRLGQDKINIIIHEEMRHVTVLSNELTSLKG